jgi:hypothetical protein
MNRSVEKTAKKHPCPDCNFCQWCSSDRCGLCRSDCPGKGRKKKKKKKGDQPLFRSY